MATDFEHGGLKWVIDEIYESLKQARVHLESFVEDDEDSSQLQFCTTYLHQVSGSLNMLELSGAALLSEEMECLSQAIYDDKVIRREDSFEVLMRALIQLPDYLERLQRGARDLPMVLLPLLNDLRASRGEQLLTEGAVFAADLSLDKIKPEPDNGIAPAQLAKKIRHHFHLGLLGWYRDSNSIASLNKASKVISKLKESVKTANFYQLFSLLEAFIEGLMDKGIEPSASTKLLLGQADRYIKHLIDEGEDTDLLSDDDAQELLNLNKNLLFYIAHSKNPDSSASGPLVQAIKDTYNLADIIPDENELEDARASMGGANAELMEAVTSVISSDLTMVKEQLDVYVRNYNDGDSPLDDVFLLDNEQQRDDLQAIIGMMSQIADTLAMLGQNAPRNVLQEKVEQLKAIINGDEESGPDTLDEVASSLLFVESSLAKMGQAGLFYNSEDEPGDLSHMEISEQEKQQLSNSVISEARTELQKIKEGIVAVIEGHAEGEDEEFIQRHINSASQGLMNISAVLDMLDKKNGCQIVRDCAEYTASQLVVGRELISKDEQQYLADTITAIEYYLEAILEQQQDLSIIESVARSGMDKLHGREPEQAEEESKLSRTLFTWMEDVSLSESRENLLNVITSIAEQVKLLQHDKAEDIAHQMKSMINLVGNNQTSLNDDISSTLRWATETLNRIIQTATEKAEAAESENQNDSEYEHIEDESEHEPELENPELADKLEQELEQGQPDTSEDVLTAETLISEELTLADEVEAEPRIDTGASIDVGEEPAANYPDIKKLEISEDVDHEIMEIFIEEAREEISKISELFPKWRENPEQQEPLTEMRRSFHTLKGSGRLVGAYEMGEFAWAYENMLNRILDNSITVNDILKATIATGIEMLPEIIAAFEAQRLSEADSSRLAAYAHILSKGESFDIARLAELDGVLQEAKIQELEEESRTIDETETESITEEMTAKTEQLEESVEEDEGLDPVLLDIFTNEAAGHIENIEQYIELCHQKNDHCYPDEILIRSLHTLRGSAHMADIHAIGNVSELMEKVIKLIVEKGQKIDAPLLALLDASCQFCAFSLEYLKNSNSLPDINTELEEQIEQMLEQVKHLENLNDEEIDETISISEEQLERNEDQAQEQETDEAAHHEYDDELLVIFIEEGEELLDSSAQSLNKLKENPQDQDTLQRLLRDMHTLKGGARMAGVMAIGDLSYSFESKLEQFTNGDINFASEHVELLQTVQDNLSTMLERLKCGQSVDNMPELISQLDNMSEIAEISEQDLIAGDADIIAQVTSEIEKTEHQTVESTEQPEEIEASSSEYDDELLDIFLEEAQELMDSSDASLSYLKTQTEDSERLKELLRDLHTLKGGARMAGIDPISDLTHSLETQLEQITEQNQSLSPQFFELLYQAHDAISEMLDDLKSGRPVKSAVQLLARAEAFSRGEIEAEEAETEQQLEAESEQKTKEPEETEQLQEQQPDTTDTIVAEEESSEHQEAAELISDTAAIELEQTIMGTEPEEERPESLARETTPDKRTKTERVRVSADLLDELVNFAGEVSIYRSRLDQGNTGFQTSLEEMNTTIIRLREQLRRFEMETEAQIQSRRDQAESMGYERYEEFDPLEFDRFSSMQQITRAMAETVADLDSIENSMVNLNSEAETLLIQQGRVNTDLQEGLMRTRMVPFKSQLPRFRRIIRQTAQELNKKVEFKLYGEDQEIDRRVLEKIMAPLEHMFRNAIAHGIEAPEQRIAAGKTETGNLKLIIGRDGSEIEIRVIDDGAGINIAEVRNKAIEYDLMVEGAGLSDNDIMRFIIESGFSTATEVSQISGRGVGMDVVNNEIKQLNGTLDIKSEPGKGSVFDIHMPLTMSVSRALMVQVGEEIFAIPLVGIENIIRESHDVLEKLTAANNTFYQWHDEQYQFMHLGTALGINKPSLPGEKNKSPILLARSGEHRIALFVDALMGSREIVVKSVGPQLSTVKGVTGATILGDGKIALILDLGILAREGAAMQNVAEQSIDVPTLDEKVTTVMVVDDSITVRKVTQRLLQRHDYEVITAKDGVDAIAMLHESIPDVMLLDVEMPRMDGFELATHMRDDEVFQNIPIIMITSRTGEKHRDRALKIGVNEYMGKPYQEHDLIRNIKNLTDS